MSIRLSALVSDARRSLAKQGPKSKVYRESYLRAYFRVALLRESALESDRAEFMREASR